MNSIMKRMNIGRYALVLLVLSMLMVSIPAASAVVQPLVEGTQGNSVGVPPDYGWYLSQVKVTLTSNNPIVYKINGDLNDPNGWKEYKGSFPIIEEGVSTVHYKEIWNWGPTIGQLNIYIDTLKPENKVIVPDPNSYGWYNYNPIANFKCDEPWLGSSGCILPDTANIQIPPGPPFEGVGLSASWTAKDNAGNENTKTVYANVDITKPVLESTEIIPLVPNGKNGWYTSTVKVVVDAVDKPSAPGIAPSGLIYNSHSEWVLVNDGKYCTLNNWVEDKAGNGALYPLQCINIDKTKPTIDIIGVVEGGTYKDPVKVDIGIFDKYLDPSQTDIKLNGVAYVSGTLITAEGNYELKVTACDFAGNCESKSVKFVVDKTLPTITGKTATDPNANGWYNKDVTVKFTCTDDRSGIASCGPDQIVSTNGANQYVTGYAVDKAGNKNSALVGPINLDKVPPIVTGAALTLPNTDGWYDSDVNVKFDAIDLLSGVEGLPPHTKTILSSGEGLNVQVLGTFLDNAGNSATGIVTLKVDKTKPKITISGVEDGKTYNGPVTPVVTIEDCSGCIKTSSITLDGVPFVSGTIVKADGTYVLEASATDYAGRSADPKKVTFKIETPLGPTVDITGVEDGKTYTSSITPIVTITAPAGIKEQIITLNGAPFTSGTTVSADGDYKLSVSVTDNNGNVAKKTVIFTLDIAQAPGGAGPTIEINGVEDGKTYKNSVKPIIEIDAPAGIASQSITLNGKPFTSGAKISNNGNYVLYVEVTDNNGETAEETVSFTVAIPSVTQKATGGGSIIGPKKNNVNFGFTALLKNGKASGNVQFTDQKSKIVLKGTVKSMTVNANKATISGTGKVGTKNVNFVATVEDWGTPGKGKDIFNIKITGPISYSAGGKLTGGNIAIK